MANEVSLVDDVVSEYRGIEAQMSDPSIAGDQAQFGKLSKRYAELRPIMLTYEELTAAQEDLEAAREMAYEDHDFQSEADELADQVEQLQEKLADLLAPRDPQDAEDIIMEIKAGAGGEEAALFAADLARMYRRFADKAGFAWNVLALNESDLGGVKDMTISFRAKTLVATVLGRFSSMRVACTACNVSRSPNLRDVSKLPPRECWCTRSLTRSNPSISTKKICVSMSTVPPVRAARA